MIRNSIIILLTIILIITCTHSPKSQDVPSIATQETFTDALFPPEVTFDLDKIKKRDTLIALTQYSTNTFFIYRGQPMGYEYELLKLFADDLGVELKIKTQADWDSLFIMLKNGEGDLIAANLAITLERQKHFAFSEPHTATRQMLIQRKPDNYKKLKLHEIEATLIKEPYELINKTVSVRAHTSYFNQLKSLSQQVGGEIFIDTLPPSYETEQIIALVSDGTLNYTVADENIAIINSTYFDNIDIQTPLSFAQPVGWAFRQSSMELKVAADSWMKKLKAHNNPHYYVIYNRYYSGKRRTKKYRAFQSKSLKDGEISPYDSLFKKYQTKTFSWVLLASLAYQESQFDPNAHSNMGAKGLMQLLPNTAKELGYATIKKPKENIQASIAYLEYIHKRYWNALPQEEALKFSLASYNAGPGHILDAQKLAASLNLDPTLWSNNVEVALLKLQSKQYYTKPIIKYGYVRGTEPVKYVREILARQELYKQQIDARQSFF